ncbi:MAG: hypothetical protein IKI64_07825 [Clostridia bacterium]|nr:hypothetical protein [Clostridia bacterium]
MKEKRMNNMKKLAALALAALIGCTLLPGCAGDLPTTWGPTPTAPPTEAAKTTDAPLEIPLEKVFTVGDRALVNAVYTAAYDIIAYVNVERESDKEGTTRKCSFGGKEYELFYKRTRTFSLGGACYYDYTTNSDDVNYWEHPYMDRYSIAFHSSGALAYINNYDFEPELKLDFEGSVDADSARAAVEKLLESELDFGKFERFDSAYQKWQFPTEDGESGHYELHWFNEKVGEEPPCGVTATVTQKGKLIRINADDPAAEPMQLPEGFDFVPYLDAIKMKARELCTNSGEDAELEIREFSATTIGGSPYVWARVQVMFDSFSLPDDAYKNSAEFAVPIE